MKKTTKYLLAGVAVAALVTAAIATILNKRWWGNRINAKWDVATGSDMAGQPIAGKDSPWTIYGPDFQKWSLPQLYDAWKNGVKGWYPKGERPEVLDNVMT